MDVNHVNRLGWTALIEAIILGDGSQKYADIVTLLIDGGADVIYTLLHSPPQNHLRVCAWRHLDRLLRKPDRHSGYMK